MSKTAELLVFTRISRELRIFVTCRMNAPPLAVRNGNRHSEPPSQTTGRNREMRLTSEYERDTPRCRVFCVGAFSTLLSASR
jgi:hypothetical protein